MLFYSSCNSIKIMLCAQLTEDLSSLHQTFLRLFLVDVSRDFGVGHKGFRFAVKPPSLLPQIVILFSHSVRLDHLNLRADRPKTLRDL